MNIRAYRKRDATYITELFHESVHAISEELYTSKEREAWAPTPPDYEIWEKRLEKKRPFVGLLDNRIVGFIELEIDGHIDCFYVHNKYQNSITICACARHCILVWSIGKIWVCF